MPIVQTYSQAKPKHSMENSSRWGRLLKYDEIMVSSALKNEGEKFRKKNSNAKNAFSLL